VKQTYAGITIDLPTIVEIIDVYARTPVFHVVDGYENGPDGYWRTLTRCKLTCYEEYPIRDTGRTYTHDHVRASLPARHAVGFARPCTRCWPELRNQRSLFKRPAANPRVEQEALA
jgi:hypothetical protein